MDGQGGQDDLVVLALPGVQRFIAEARSTSDVRAASQIYARLASMAAATCQEAGGKLVLPSGLADPDSMPNRVAAVFPPGSGADAARKMQKAVHEKWFGWLGEILPHGVVETPGMPLVHWVCMPAGDGGYRDQWQEGQRLLAARRMVRDFQAVEWRRRALCSLGPRWPAVDPPKGLKAHEKATLSAAGWVKRRWRELHDLEGFPSTSSIASAPFRLAVLESLDDREVYAAVSDLARAAREVIRAIQDGDVRETRIVGLPEPKTDLGKWFASTAGPWVYPARWQAESLAGETGTDPAAISAVVVDGRKAASKLHEVMKARRVPEPTAYLAVMVQDIDGLGRFLGGEASSVSGARIEPSVASHRRVSELLGDTAREQSRVLEEAEFLGVPVYAGGDDLLAFTPARTALMAARRCHEKMPPELPTASTAVLFFHYHTGLQIALTRARRLLDEAKHRVDGKHALAVGYLRGSGVSEVSIQPWPGPDGRDTADLFRVFATDAEHPLSPRLLADLERDHAELARLSRQHPAHYRAELTRLVRRHIAGGQVGGGDAVSAAARAAAALEWLGAHENAGPPRAPEVSWPDLAARVGVFLRQEAR
ncbi:MAG: Cas10/Cmr2 second palm domain-containing protein [Streptosporangiaceae bacterium]